MQVLQPAPSQLFRHKEKEIYIPNTTNVWNEI